MKRLPPPTTFSEGQRFLYGLLAAAAGMFCGAMSIAMICLLMWGNWSSKEEHTIVVIFGWSLGGFIAAMIAVIIGLLTGGPVGRFKANVSKTGLDLETSAPDQQTITAAAATGAAVGAAVAANTPPTPAKPEPTLP